MLKQANLSFSVAAQSFGDDVTSIQFSTQDKNTAKLIFTIKEGKKPLDLTDAEGIVDLVMGDKSIFEDNKATITAPLDGKLEYTITADQIRHPGRARGELQLISKDGQSIGGFRFNFTIKRALVDEYAGPVKEYYVQDLEAIKAEIRKTADSIKDLDVVRIDTKLNELEQKVEEGGVGVDEQARQEIEEVTSQLADTTTINLKHPPAPLKGAKGDGVTDDKPAIQAIVNYLKANGGGTILAPKGTYMMKSGVQWATKISLIGAGIIDTKFVAEGELFDVFVAINYDSYGRDADNPDAWLEDCRFENLQVDLAGLTNTQSNVNGKAFFMLYMKRARFHNLYLRNTIGTALGCDFLVDTVIDNVIVENAGRNFGQGNVTVGQSGIGIGTGAVINEGVVVSNCHIYDCGNYGIFVETQDPNGIKSQNAKIINNHVQGNKYGIGNKGSGGLHVSGNTIIENREHGILLSEDAENNIVIDNVINGNKGAGISVAGNYKENLIVSGNQIAKNTEQGIALVNATNINKKVKITDNSIYNNGKNGISIAGRWSDFQVTNNLVKNNSKNISSFNYTSGIILESLNTSVVMSNFIITDNMILDDQETKTQKIAIKSLNTGLSNFLVSNNHIIGYPFADSIALGGVLTGVVLKNNTGFNDYTPVQVIVPTSGTSPWVYTASNRPEVLYLLGTGIGVSISGNTMVNNVTSFALPLAPNQQVTITYTTLTSAKIQLQ